MTTDRFKSRPELGTRVQLPVERRDPLVGVVSGEQPADEQHVRVLWPDGLSTVLRCEQLRPEATSAVDTDLDAIEARAAKAFRGPWTVEEMPETGECRIVNAESADLDPAFLYPVTSGGSIGGDAEFIAAAREDVPALIARVRTAETAVDYWRTQVLASRAAESTPVHCPSCDGYQTAVMDNGQRSVGVCEGLASRTVEMAEEFAGVPDDELPFTLAGGREMDRRQAARAAGAAEDWFSYEEVVEMLEFHGADSDRIDADARRIAAAPPSRTVETAEEWQYSVEWSRERGSSYVTDWSGWAWTGDRAGAESFARAHLDGKVLRRRAPGPTEPVPPTPEEADRG